MRGEKWLEKNFNNWCRERDMYPVKGPANLAKGIPDRFLAITLGGGTIYVEFKGSSSYGLQPMQEWWQTYLLDSSPNRYFVIDSEEDLANLKATVLALQAIGPELIAYETELLKKYYNKENSML